MFQYQIRANLGFKDGCVYPRALRVGEVLIVDEQTYNKMRRSDPESIELIQRLVPNPVKKDKAPDA